MVFRVAGTPFTHGELRHMHVVVQNIYRPIDFREAKSRTFAKWLQKYWVQKAKALLLESATAIARIAAICGLADQSHLKRFSRCTSGRAQRHGAASTRAGRPLNN
ncbi:helix-turn-helix domain-containing protein [Bradyrhizobium genosp. P]|uniref:helix-turn-helix domain-containing protein n=1 Tax=Bradyrhizobium genosp. P TaxID=83641 RepID=UPI003CF36FF4